MPINSETCQAGVCGSPASVAPEGTPCASDGNPCTADRCSGDVCDHQWVAGGCMDNPDPVEGVDRAWYGWTPLRGHVAAAPVAVVSLGDAGFEVYTGSARVRVIDGMVGDWDSMGGGGPDEATPAVVRTRDRDGTSASTIVVVRDGLGGVWWRRFADVDADSTGWQSLSFCSTTLAGRPSLHLHGDTLEVLGVTGGGGLCHTRLTRSDDASQLAVQSSTLLGAPSAALVGAPTAIDYKGELRAYAVAADGYLYEKKLDGQTGGFARISKDIDIFNELPGGDFVEIGGVLAGPDLPPAAVYVPEDDRIHVFAQGNAEPPYACTWWNGRPPNYVRHVQHPSAYATNGGFGPAFYNRVWQISDSLGNLIEGGPVVVQTGGSGQHVQIFATSRVDHSVNRYAMLAHASTSTAVYGPNVQCDAPCGDWGAWQSIGGRPAYRPAVATRPDGSVDVIAVGAGGAVYAKHLAPAAEQGASLSDQRFTTPTLTQIPVPAPRPAERTLVIVRTSTTTPSSSAARSSGGSTRATPS